MDLTTLLTRMEHTGAAARVLLSTVSDADARWKPPSGAWAILEIVAHLADEEVEDFRTRIRLTLQAPEAPWPPIDPEGAARDRSYNTRDLQTELNRFVVERGESIRWLRSLQSPSWSNTHQHPKFGPISAGTLMVSWAAHDALHLRQIAKRLFELAARDGQSNGFITTYAGEWGA
jgi:hypothetical protein